MLLMLAMWSNVIFISDYTNYIKILALTILMVQIILNFKKMSQKNLMIYLFLFTFFLISYFFCSDYTLLFLPFLLIGFENVDFEKFIKVEFIVKACLFVLVLIFNYYGLTNTVFTYRDHGFIRSSLGFSHPNVIGLYLLSMCAEFVYIRGRNIKLFDILIWIIIAIIFDHYTDSRTSFFCIFLLLGITLILKYSLNSKNIQIKKNMKIKMMILPFTLTIICFIFAILYKNNFQSFANYNKILSGRLYYWSYFIDSYNINFFGHYITKTKSILISSSRLILDNSFIRIILEYGIISAISFYYIIYNLIKKAFNNNKIYLVMIIFIFMVAGLFENNLYQYQFNVFLLYAFNKFSK